MVIAAVVLYHAVNSPPRSFLHILATAVATFTMIAGVGVILTLDRPFSGVVSIDPTDMQRSETDMAADYAARYCASSLPCDETRKADGRTVARLPGRARDDGRRGRHPRRGHPRPGPQTMFASVAIKRHQDKQGVSEFGLARRLD